MPEPISVFVNGSRVSVTPGTTAAVAIMIAGTPCRTSVHGEGRGPLCGMGICFECCAQIDGVKRLRSCQIVCEPGMEISTNE